MMKTTCTAIMAGLLALGLATAVCGSEEIPAQWMKTEIFFGSGLPGGKQISQSSWTDFLDNVLTPHFPQGLTVYDAYGQMQHADGRIEKQSTRVVVILHPKDSATEQKIQKVVTAYREKFRSAQVVHLSAPLTTAQFFAD